MEEFGTDASRRRISHDENSETGTNTCKPISCDENFKKEKIVQGYDQISTRLGHLNPSKQVQSAAQSHTKQLEVDNHHDLNRLKSSELPEKSMPSRFT